MRICIAIAAAIAALFSAAAAPQEPASPVRYDDPVIALTHVQLVDGTGAPAREDMSVLLRDGRIAAVGPAASVAPPKGAKIIDGRGKTVIPGLVFMHEHMFYPVGGLQFGEMLESFPPLYLAGGVTTARTAGSLSPYADLNLAAAIEAGAAIGPDLHVTGPYIEGQGLPVYKIKGLADADAVERFVDYWADQGATSFKAYMLLSREQLARAVEVAHRRGARVTGHLCSITYREAADLGIDNLEHGFAVMTDFVEGKQPDVCPFEALDSLMDNVDPDSAEVRALIDHLVESNVVLTSTLVPFEDLTPGRPEPSKGALAAMLPEIRAQHAESRQALATETDAAQAQVNFAKILRLERMFVEAGGILMAGTDPTALGGVIPGFASKRQIELLVEAGFPFEQAIRIGTLNGARFLKRDEEIGTVEVGKRADLVLIDGDPTQDAAAIRNMPVVFKAGIGYDTGALIDAAAGLVGIR